MKRVIAAFATLVGLSAARGADVEFLRELVSIPSVSRDVAQVNRAVQCMKAYLEKRGVFCVVETMPGGREVLYASITPGKGHDFVLAPHIDVVPAADPSQFTMTQKGDRVYGRGTSDCKGRAAAVAELLASLAGSGLSVGCLFGSDEEIGGHATKWMVDEKGYVAKKMAIVPDTSADTVVYAQKGHTLYRVKARGRSGHSSAPWNCDDSITKLTRGYVRVRDEWDRRHPLPKDKWSDVLTPTMVKGFDGAYNIIPGEVEMVLNLRSVNPAAKDEALELLKAETGCEVEVMAHSDPVTSDPGHPLMQSLRSVMRETTGKEIPMTRMLAATDARCFVSCGVPVAVVGTHGRGAHSADEWVSLSSLDQMRDYLAKFLRREAK